MAKKPISAEDFSAWKDNTITLAVFAHLSQTRGLIAERWLALLNGEVAADPKAMQLIQVELKAKLEFIEDLTTIELSDIQEEAEQNAEAISNQHGTDQRVERVRRSKAG